MAIGTALAIGSLVGTGLQAAQQYSESQEQSRKAARIDTTRPRKRRTKASVKREGLARSRAMTSRLPGQSYYEDQIGAQQARATRQIKEVGGSASDVISGITDVDRNTRNQQMQLAQKGAQFQSQARQQYQNVLGDVAAEQERMWDYNVNQPFQTRLLKKESLKGAARRNRMGATRTLTQGLSSAAGIAQQQKVLNIREDMVDEGYAGDIQDDGGSTAETNALPGTERGSFNKSSNPSMGSNFSRYERQQLSRRQNQSRILGP